MALMRFTAHRRRCEAVLSTLDIPTPFTLETFCATLGAQRGRPIELLAMTSKNPPWSAWIAGRTADWIFYEARTSSFHRQQLILLQLGHLLLDHPPDASVAHDDPPSPLLGGLSRHLIRDLHALGRTRDPDPVAEHQADLFGCLLLQRASQLSPPLASGDADRDDAQAAVLHRLAVVLEGRPR